jgi:cytochrome c
LLTIVSSGYKPTTLVLDCSLNRPAKAVKLLVNKIMESDMKRILVAVIALGAMFSNAAFASEQLAKEKNCLACHAVDNKLVGPGYKEVAAKYKGDKSAEDKLAQKIMKGGSGVWGQIPMPANPQVSAAEAKTLAKWVLSLK